MKERFNYRHIICIFITIGFLACGVIFSNALGRLLEGVRDFGLSIAYYFCEIFGFDGVITPTVTDFPQIPFFPVVPPEAPPVAPEIPSIPLPDNWEQFTVNWGIYWGLWACGDNFLGYMTTVSNGIYTFCQFLIIALPIIVLLIVCFKQYLKTQNNDYDKDSKPLKAFKWFFKRIYCPVKAWFAEIFIFIGKRKYYWVPWLCLWLFYFNVFTIVVEFFAFYFYFVISFDILNIYRQVYKMFLDLSVPFTFIPLWVWVIVGLFLFNKFRRNIGYARLNHNERKNCGFINERALTTLVCGTMGKGKTTMLTSMCLSTEVLFRDKAFELLLACDFKFPNFPWINLENTLRWAIRDHKVYSLATCRQFVRLKYSRWLKNPCKEKLFNYDYEQYGFTYNDDLKVVDVWKVIEDYTQLYFIYVMQSSLIVSNYSIRSDMLMSDVGNFPLWNGDFFRRDSRLIDSYSRHAHILDFDILRLGKTVVAENKYRNLFEFGVVAVSEIGKERLNSKVSQSRGIKAKNEETNQANDGFVDGLKMARHRATVCDFPFLKIISDEQRSMSLEADERELFDIVNISDKSETALFMPFFALEELIYDGIFSKFCDLYVRYRYNRGDNTLLIYLIKGIVARLHHYYCRTYNLFGCHCLNVQLQSGMNDGKFKLQKYYISHKKDYSKRFATDCFADFFREKSLLSDVGFDDLPEYKTERATWDELKRQSSYFVKDLEKYKDNNN